MFFLQDFAYIIKALLATGVEENKRIGVQGVAEDLG